MALSKEEFTILNKILSDVQLITKDLLNVVEKQRDHEKRLRFLERYGFMAMGAIGFISLLISFFK